jgi:hypothetical protein
MFYIKSIGEDGPQYMQEDVDAADLDAAGEGFIGMDDDDDEDEDLDDIPLELAPFPVMASGTTPKHTTSTVPVLTVGGSNGIAVKNMVINRLRDTGVALARTDSAGSNRSVPPLSVGTSGLFPGTPKLDLTPVTTPQLAPLNSSHLDGAENLPVHLREKMGESATSGSLPSGSLTERGPAVLERGTSSGSVTERKAETTGAGMSTARQNFEMQKHLAQRLLWAADLPAPGLTATEMAELNLEGMERDGLCNDGSATARYREPVRTREASSEVGTGIDGRARQGSQVAAGRLSTNLEDMLSPKSQVRAGLELEEVEVMLDKMEFLLTLRFGFDGKPMLVLRKAADLLVRQLRASVDVNRRSLSREPDVISPGEQERLLEMIGGMRGLLQGYRDSAERCSRNDLVAQVGYVNPNHTVPHC